MAKRAKASSSLSGARRGGTPGLDGTQVIFCGDNLNKLRELSAGCVDLAYIDPPFNSNRN